MLSANCGLCATISGDVFGSQVTKVVKFLLQKPGSMLHTLFQGLQKPKLSMKELKKILAILYQHQLLIINPSPRNPEVKELSIDKEKFLYFVLFPKFLEVVERKKNRVHGVILQELFIQGRDPPSVSIFRAAKYLKTFVGVDSDTPIKVQDIMNRYLDLVREKYVVPVPPMEAVDNRVPEIVSEPDFGPKLLQKIAKALEDDLAITNLGELGDETQLWTLNFEKFGEDLRYEMIQEAAKNMIDSNAAEVLRIAHNAFDERMRTSQGLNFNRDEMTSQAQRRHLVTKPKDVAGYLQILAKLEFIEEVPDSTDGVYTCDMTKSTKKLVQGCVEKAVAARYGKHAMRIFNAISSMSLVSIEDLYPKIPLSASDVNRHVHSLVNHGFVQQFDFLKSGPANAKNVTWQPTLEKVEFDKVVRNLLHRMYRGLLNLKVVSKREIDESDEIVNKKVKYDNLLEEVNEAKAAEPERAEELDMILIQFFPEDDRKLFIGTQKKFCLLNGIELKLASEIFLFESYLKAVTVKHIGKAKASLASMF